MELNSTLPVSFDLTGLRKFTEYTFYARYYGSSNISTTLNFISSRTSTRTAEDGKLNNCCQKQRFVLFFFFNFFYVDYLHHLACYATRLMTMSLLYPCGKPCSRGTHDETMKTLALFFSIINGIMIESQLRISIPWECFQFFNRIEDSIISKP